MVRARDAEAETSLSMFPFLSILVGVIGTLVLIIAGMMVLGLQSSDQVVELLPHDVATHKKAVFVECQDEGILLHPAATFVPLSELTSHRVWKRRLADLQEHAGEEYLVLLIRPDGKKSFDICYAMARAAKLDVGFDPVFAGGKIRFREAPRSRRP